MAQYVYRFPPCPIYDMEAIEGWIESQALNGLKLIKYNLLGLFVFEKSELKAIRCRLEAAQKNHASWENAVPPAPMLELAQESGWTFVTYCGGFYVFLNHDSTAPELNTDPGIQALTLRFLRKRWCRSMIFMLIYLTVLLFGIAPGFFYHMVSFNSLLLIFGSLFIFLETGTNLLGLIHITRLYRRLSSGQPLSHKPLRKRNEKIYPISQYAAYLLAVALILCTARYHMNQLGLGQYPLADYPGAPPFLTLEDLAPEHTEITYSKIDNSYYQAHPDFLIPVNLYWMDGGEIRYPDGTSTAGLLEVTYCEAFSPWLARAIGKDYLDFYTILGKPESIFLPELGIDYAQAFYDRYGLARVVLAEGSIAVCVRFSMNDPHDYFTIESWATAMAQRLLAEGGN